VYAALIKLAFGGRERGQRGLTLLVYEALSSHLVAESEGNDPWHRPGRLWLPDLAYNTLDMEVGVVMLSVRAATARSLLRQPDSPSLLLHLALPQVLLCMCCTS
jgi:hypothetical protein